MRVYLGGVVVADTNRPKLVWELPYYPTYYFPAEDVRQDLLTPTDRRGDTQLFRVAAGHKVVEGGASRRDELPDLLRFEWVAMDAWFEEDEEVYVHARDPHTRIDILASSRRIRVDVSSITVAESDQPRLLFETGLPTRYYLPQTDVRMELLRPSDTVTQCPYKGTANYWSVQTGDNLATDLAWIYRTPLPESQKIAGLVAFYNDRVDLFVDGVAARSPNRPAPTD